MCGSGRARPPTDESVLLAQLCHTRLVQVLLLALAATVPSGTCAAESVGARNTWLKVGRGTDCGSPPMCCSQFTTHCQSAHEHGTYEALGARCQLEGGAAAPASCTVRCPLRTRCARDARRREPCDLQATGAASGVVAQGGAAARHAPSSVSVSSRRVQPSAMNCCSRTLESTQSCLRYARRIHVSNSRRTLSARRRRHQ
jgi:hypothetical protein